MKLIKELKDMANLRKLDVMMTRRSNHQGEDERRASLHLMESLRQRGSRSAMPEPPLTLLTPVEQAPEGPRPTSSTRTPGNTTDTQTRHRVRRQSAAPNIVSTFMTYSKDTKTRRLARALYKTKFHARQLKTGTQSCINQSASRTCRARRSHPSSQEPNRIRARLPLPRQEASPPAWDLAVAART